jgi:hypothetical protein
MNRCFQAVVQAVHGLAGTTVRFSGHSSAKARRDL